MAFQNSLKTWIQRFIKPKLKLQVRCGHMEVSTREQSSLVLAVEKTLTDRLEEVF